MSEPVLISQEEIPEELRKPLPVAPEPNHIIPKRTAHSVAEQITGERCRLKDKEGCWITVKFPRGPLHFRGATWWLALRELNHYLTTTGKGPKSEA